MGWVYGRSCRAQDFLFGVGVEFLQCLATVLH